jgi:hypothetical protein
MPTKKLKLPPLVIFNAHRSQIPSRYVLQVIVHGAVAYSFISVVRRERGRKKRFSLTQTVMKSRTNRQQATDDEFVFHNSEDVAASDTCKIPTTVKALADADSLGSKILVDGNGVDAIPSTDSHLTEPEVSS